jgi:allene oxide cyclase
MKRLLILVAATAALVVLAVVAAAGARSTAVTVTFRVVEHATTDATTDTGKKGDSAGDVLTFANAVYNGGNTKKVGSDNGYCIRTVVKAAYECIWTTSLSGGQLTVEGPFLDAGDSKLAITGGTGSYSRARGWMGLHARNANGTEYDFVFHVQS